MVGVALRGKWVEAEMMELAELARTSGAEVVGMQIQRLDRFDAAFWIGQGKSKMIAEQVQADGISLVVFNGSLSPTQVRNLQDLFGTEVKVLDRTGLILDIFAQHARSRDSKLRVELAQLNYLLPRLPGLWRHLERQQGGIGTRGPGETQIEVDRRSARKRISLLQDQIARLGRARAVQRSTRGGVPRAALVGYTNAGKSTLLNILTHADVTTADMLFSTLDTKTAAMVFESHQIPGRGPARMLLSDTVGFIRNLPEDLFDAFLSTLDEVREADLILHVVDISNQEFPAQAEVVTSLLKKILGDASRPILTVMNKADVPGARQEHLLRDYPDSLFVSAKTGLGMSALREALRQKVFRA